MIHLSMEATQRPEDEFEEYVQYAMRITNTVGMNSEGLSCLQDWVHKIPFMQQAVLMSGIRTMDGWPKLHEGKHMMRWYRRAVLISSFEGEPILTPWGQGGGSFTGSAPANMTLKEIADKFLDSRDSMSLHFFSHMMHAFQIVGFKHSDAGIRGYFYYVYQRMCHALHVWPEEQAQMDRRLGDNEANWRIRADETLTCSD